jgi:uncharacterized phage protein (TIGR01671 family)
MSRDIKFRGIKKGTNDFIYGSLVSDKKQGVAIIQQLNNPINYGAANGWCFAIKPESVGQFTGLKDKNGVDIYEGDKLHCLGCDYKLIKHDSGAYELHEVGSEKVFFLFKESYKIEVIGNIHENKN